MAAAILILATVYRNRVVVLDLTQTSGQTETNVAADGRTPQLTHTLTHKQQHAAAAPAVQPAGEMELAASAGI